MRRMGDMSDNLELEMKIQLLSQENQQLREALIGVCDAYMSNWDERKMVASVRAVANKLSVPFSQTAVDDYWNERFGGKDKP